MKLVITVCLAATLLSCTASAQDSVRSPASQGAAAGQRTNTEPGKVNDTPEIVDPVERVRENLRRNAAGASNPFPYAVAIEPAREPYRRPVPCSTFARETDGTTTCIGIHDGARSASRASASAPPRKPARAEPSARPRREASIEQRRTDPRFDLAPAPLPPANNGNGFIAFLGRILSR